MRSSYKKIILIISIISISAVCGTAMAAGIPFQKIILKSTVYIKNEFGDVGTGFLISKRLENQREGTFLITNKHVLRKDGDSDYCNYIDVRFYKKKPKENEPIIQWIRIPILDNKSNFTGAIYMHPEVQVDIVGILISELRNLYSNSIDFVSFGEELILTRDIAQKELIDAGEDLLVLGYTAGIFSENNYLPLAKAGLLSSSSSEDLDMMIGNIRFKGKLYLVDSSLFGGNSGGPVFVKPRWRVTRENDNLHQTINLSESLPLYILGVQSKSIQLNEKIYTNIFTPEGAPSIKTKQNVDKKIEKDQTGEYIQIDKNIMLNVVFSAEYIKDIFNMYIGNITSTQKQINK